MDLSLDPASSERTMNPGDLTQAPVYLVAPMVCSMATVHAPSFRTLTPDPAPHSPQPLWVSTSLKGEEGNLWAKGGH